MPVWQQIDFSNFAKPSTCAKEPERQGPVLSKELMQSEFASFLFPKNYPTVFSEWAQAKSSWRWDEDTGRHKEEATLWVFFGGDQPVMFSSRPAKMWYSTDSKLNTFFWLTAETDSYSDFQEL